LSAIDGIGLTIAESIVEARDPKEPYVNIYDFYRRCDPVTLKKSTLEHLAAAGALDELIDDNDIEISRRIELEILEKEKAELGMYITNHPVMGIWDVISNQITSEIIDLGLYDSGTPVKIGGIINSVKKMTTKKGDKMFKLDLEDISSNVEVIVFPRAAKEISNEYFNVGDILIISGNLNKENDEENSITKIFYNSSEKIDQKIFTGGKPIIFVPKNNISKVTLDSIYDIISNNKGNRPVFLEMSDNKHKFIYKFDTLASTKIVPIVEKILELEIQQWHFLDRIRTHRQNHAGYTARRAADVKIRVDTQSAMVAVGDMTQLERSTFTMKISATVEMAFSDGEPKKVSCWWQDLKLIHLRAP